MWLRRSLPGGRRFFLRSRRIAAQLGDNGAEQRGQLRSLIGSERGGLVDKLTDVLGVFGGLCGADVSAGGANVRVVVRATVLAERADTGVCGAAFWGLGRHD
jgi:hypothetical protein